MDEQILVADIGGTHARFAVGQRGSLMLDQQEQVLCTDYESIDHALRNYLKKLAQPPEQIVLAVAAPIRGKQVRFVNSDWSFNLDHLNREFSDQNITALNDWEAVAYALPHLCEESLFALDPNSLDFTKTSLSTVAFGPGTGLGAACHQRQGDSTHTISTEVGHLGFAPQTQRQQELLARLQGQLGGRVSYERILSGPGLENLHKVVTHANKSSNPQFNAKQIYELGVADKDQGCLETMALWFEILGQFAGDLVMAFNAFDGVFIGGGICPRNPLALRKSRFRAGFENKGRYRERMMKTPVNLIQHPQTGLLGALAYAHLKLEN